MIYYLGVRFSKETNTQLEEWRINNNLAASARPKLGYHTTIIYSRTPFKYTIQDLLPSDHMESPWERNDVQLFGTSLVLKLRGAAWLLQQYEKCVLNGATSDYAFYQPHITIAEEISEIPTRMSIRPVQVNITELFYREW
jgi:hypothetical protein